MTDRRSYISLYFKDSISPTRKKGYITISFDAHSPIYRKCKKIGATKIKKYLGSYTYDDLAAKARSEDRSIGNYIKFVLKKKLAKKDE